MAGRYRASLSEHHFPPLGRGSSIVLHPNPAVHSRRHISPATTSTLGQQRQGSLLSQVTKASQQASGSMLSADSVNSFNKNAVSTLNEIAQKQGKEVKIELLKENKGGKDKFTMACKIGGYLYDAASGANKKEARSKACETALISIMGKNAFNVKMGAKSNNANSLSSMTSATETFDSQDKNAVTALHELSQKQCKELLFEFNETAHDDGINKFSVACRFGGHLYDVGSGPNKKEAKIKACELALASITTTKNEVKDDDTTNPTASPNVKNPDVCSSTPSTEGNVGSSTNVGISKNAVSAINEYGQKQGTKVELELTDSSGEGQSRFTYVCKIGGCQYDAGSGPNKKKARQEACKVALASIMRKSGYDNATIKNDEIKDVLESVKNPTHPLPSHTVYKNAVSTLNELAQKQGKEVKFELIAEAVGGKDKFTIACNVGGKLYKAASGANKKEAKGKACEAALVAITGRNDFNKNDENGVVDENIIENYSSCMLSSDVFNSLNKNAASALNELVQKQGKELKFELLNASEGGKNKFTMACRIGGYLYDGASGPNKKEAKNKACSAALSTIMCQNALNVEVNGVGDAIESIRNPPRTSLHHFDNIAYLCNHAFMQLSTMINTALSGKKVIAGIVMKLNEEDGGRVVAIGSGNRCITGERLSLDGKVVNDSHAEIVCRRGFIRFLYSELERLIGGDDESIFFRELSSNNNTGGRNKFKLHQGVSFHMYISTAPCGDGALFTPRENQTVHSHPTKHNPEFSSKVQGILRTKIEDGEGTIPIPHDEPQQTIDGIMRGQRLRTMSCSDKICRWNVLGLQGGLLSNFLHPVYLSSLTFGYLFDHSHLSRALCCRMEKHDVKLQLPRGFSVHHPWLGRITKYDITRETDRTNNISVNWCAYDGQPEVTDGRLGAQFNPLTYSTRMSRLCKLEMFRRFRGLCTRLGGCEELLELEVYREAKNAAREFQRAKQVMMRRFEEEKFGNWLSKPFEQDMSIVIPPT